MARVAITEQYLEDIADAIRSKTGMSTATYLPSEMADAIMTISGSGGITPTGTISITENGTYNVTNYASASVNVPTGSTINNQNKTVSSAEIDQTITADTGYTGLGTVTVTGIGTSYVGSGITRRSSTDLTASGATITAPAGYYDSSATKSVSNGTEGTPVATKGTVSNNSISVTPSVTNVAGYISGGTHTGTAVSVAASELVSGNKAITANGDNIDVTNYATVSVNVSGGGGSPTIDSLSVTPTESEQTFNNSSVDGYKPVTVGAISSTYVGSGITRGGSSSVMVDPLDNSIVVIAGYYANNVNTSMPAATNISTTASVESDGDISGSVTIGTAGYMAAASYPFTVSDAVTTRSSSDLSASGATVTAPAGYYATAATKTITSGSATAPETISGTAATLTTGTGTLTLTKTISVTPVVTAGYISSGTAGNSSVSLTASVTINPTLTASGATVTAPAGYYTSDKTRTVTTMVLPTTIYTSPVSGYTSVATVSRSTSDQYINIPEGYNSVGSYYKISAVANGSATGPSSLSGSSATVTTGTNTLTLTKTGVTTTPTVSAGYVSSATASTATVALTANITTKGATTYHPSTSNQTISSGTYTTGTQTINAVTTTNLSASNILNGVTIKIGDSSDDDCVTSVTGNVVLQNVYTGSGAPSSSTGSNGDIYIQS